MGKASQARCSKDERGPDCEGLVRPCAPPRCGSSGRLECAARLGAAEAADPSELRRSTRLWAESWHALCGPQLRSAPVTRICEARVAERYRVTDEVNIVVRSRVGPDSAFPLS